jgi:hypothetical protein
MPGCVLRVGSVTIDVEPLVKASGLRPIIIFRKGEPRVTGGTSLSPSSGFNVDVSRADGDLQKQANDAMRFLKRHDAGLRRLRRCKGFRSMTLDFAVYDQTSQTRPWPTYRLPAALIECAGRHGINIELSFYGRESQNGV